MAAPCSTNIQGIHGARGALFSGSHEASLQLKPQPWRTKFRFSTERCLRSTRRRPKAAAFVTCVVARSSSLRQRAGGRASSLSCRAWGQQGGGKANNETVPAVTFPEDYEELIVQAQDAVARALRAGITLMEVEFPPNGIESVAGDADGSTEMNRNTGFLRDFCELFTKQGQGERTRVFFPDAGELELAVMGAGLNPGIGQWEIAPTFDDVPFRLDYLGADSPLSEMSYKMMGYAGTQTKKRAVADLVRPDDEVFVVGYPSDSTNEMLLVQELHESPARQPGVPVIVFNGQLDDVRSGFYPKLFSPKLHKLQQEFLPQIEAAYYIHNFKGSRPGVLFRAYPGPWQVFRREYDGTVQDCIHTSNSMPSLKEVALEILAR